MTVYLEQDNLISNSRAELDAFARQIGVLSPVQRPGTAVEHYTLTREEQELAMEQGALRIVWVPVPGTRGFTMRTVADVLGELL